MRATGIDIGSRYVKAITVKNNKLGFGIAHIKGDLKEAVKKACSDSYKGLSCKHFEKTHVMTTGSGAKGKTRFQFKSPSLCLSRALIQENKEGGIIIDAGFMNIQAYTVSHKGKVLDTASNERCSSGSGRFMEVMTRALNLSFLELDTLAEKSTSPYKVNSGCIVFAESELITQVNSGRKREDIVRGMSLLAGGKCATILDLIKAETSLPVYFVGGLAEFKSVRNELALLTNANIKNLTVNPLYASAFGALLLAYDNASNADKVKLGTALETVPERNI